MLAVKQPGWVIHRSCTSVRENQAMNCLASSCCSAGTLVEMLNPWPPRLMTRLSPLRGTRKNPAFSPMASTIPG